MDEKKVMLEFVYKKPSIEDAKKISEIKIEDMGNHKSKDSKDAAKSYKTHYKKQATQFLIGGLICAAIGAVCIFAMVSGVDGPFSFLVGLSETLLGVISIIMPLAGLALLVMAIVFFIKMNITPASSRFKSPEALFRTLFDDNIYFVNKIGSLTKIESNMAKQSSFGCMRLCKLVPEDLRITQEQFNEYCLKLDKTVKKAEKTIEHALKTDTMSEMENGVTISVYNINELYHNIYEVGAVFTRAYKCYYNKFQNNTIAILEFNVKGTLVKSGEYWYPYDLMPDLRVVSGEMNL